MGAAGVTLLLDPLESAVVAEDGWGHLAQSEPPDEAAPPKRPPPPPLVVTGEGLAGGGLL